MSIWKKAKPARVTPGAPCYWNVVKAPEQGENDWVMEIMLKGSTEICQRTIGGAGLTREKAEEIAEYLCNQHGHSLVMVKRASFRSGV